MVCSYISITDNTTSKGSSPSDDEVEEIMEGKELLKDSLVQGNFKVIF